MGAFPKIISSVESIHDTFLFSFLCFAESSKRMSAVEETALEFDILSIIISVLVGVVIGFLGMGSCASISSLFSRAAADVVAVEPVVVTAVEAVGPSVATTLEAVLTAPESPGTFADILSTLALVRTELAAIKSAVDAVPASVVASVPVVSSSQTVTPVTVIKTEETTEVAK